MRIPSLHFLTQRASRWGKRLALAAWATGVLSGLCASPLPAQQLGLADPDGVASAPLVPPDGTELPQDGVGEIVSSWEGGEMLPVDPYLRCPPGFTIQADALFFNREGESNISLSNGFRLEDFGIDTGMRFSFQRHLDCLDGWEIAYVGPFEWEERGSVTGPGFDSGMIFPGTPLTAFDGATYHFQRYKSTLNSLEWNRRWWGWDVLSTHVGVRYINVDEDFEFESRDPVDGTGLVQINTENHLIGAQFGGDWIWPWGRLSSTTKIKGGAFANFDESRVFLSNNGTVLINNSQDDVEFAAMGEFSYYLTYNVTPRLAVRGGYEFWYIYGLALAPDQFSNPLSAGTGRAIDGNEDIWYHGAIAGVEYVW